MSEKSPAGISKFKDALRAVASVPKEKVDAKVAANKKTRAKQRKKK